MPAATEAFSDSTMFRHWDAGDGIACLAYETAQAVAFGTEHHNQRIGFETGFNEGVAATVKDQRCSIRVPSGFQWLW